MLAISWIQRRHIDALFQMPFKLCILADPAATPEQKQATALAWDQLSGCCVRPGFARKLKARNISGEELLRSDKFHG